MKYTIRNWAELKAYLSDIAYSHPVLAIQADGRGMVINYSDRRLDREPDDNRYPLLEVSPPRYTADISPQGGRRLAKYAVTIAVLSAVDIDDYRGQELVHEALEPIINAIIARMLDDKVLRKGAWPVYPVSNESHDNLWGWTATLTIEIEEAFCYHASEWLDVVRLSPVWTEGETTLSVTVNGEVFTVDWTENTYAAKLIAVKKLAELISAFQFSTEGIFSAEFFDSEFFETGGNDTDIGDGSGDPDPAHLIIIGAVPGSATSVTPGPDGHAWIEKTTSWL